MAYTHDIFVSYRRSPTVGLWVRNHLVPRLSARLDDVSAAPVKIYCDYNMEEGVNWPIELKNKIRTSSLLLTVWSANYFRSAWCMAEWQSFRRREKLLGLFGEQLPQGLVYPVRYADGEHFHREAQVTSCRIDFTELNHPDEVFRESAQYLAFDKLVAVMADQLETRLQNVPQWQDDFPIVEPEPLSSARISRPTIR